MKRNAALETDLAVEHVAWKVVENESVVHLKRMESVSIVANLHTHTELMEEFKDGKHAKWDLDYEIGVWHKHEKDLASGILKEEEEQVETEQP